MRVVALCWVAVSVVVFLSTGTDAFQARFSLINYASNSEKYRLRPRTRPAVNDILMAKGFGSATDKKKPVTDAMSKANNPAIPPVPIVKHELPSGSQFMGVFLLHINSFHPEHFDGSKSRFSYTPIINEFFKSGDLCSDVRRWVDNSRRIGLSHPPPRSKPHTEPPPIARSPTGRRRPDRRFQFKSGQAAPRHGVHAGRSHARHQQGGQGVA
jgi:hypothetical protein